MKWSSGGLLSNGVRSDVFNNTWRVRDGVRRGVISPRCRATDGVRASKGWFN